MSFSKSLPWEPPSFSHARDSSARAWRTLTHPWVSQDTKHHHVSLLIPSDQLCSERHVWWQPAGDKGQQRRITHPLHPKRLHVVEMRKEVPSQRDISVCHRRAQLLQHKAIDDRKQQEEVFPF